MKWLLPIAAIATGAWLATRQAGTSPAFALPDGWQSDPIDPAAEPDQLPGLFESAAVTFDPRNLLPISVGPDQAAANVRAFIETIGYSEGADYNTLYGGGTFSDFTDHPRQAITAGGYTSTAAGKGQILSKTWDGLVAKLGRDVLPDFSPASQDRAIIELIRERGALRDVQEGRIGTAIGKLGNVWASLPGSPYGQRTRSLSSLLYAFARSGGILESQA